MSEHTRSIELDVVLDGTPDEAWEAISTSDGLSNWFPLAAEVTPGVGGTVWLSWGPGSEGKAPIHIWEPGARFGWTESYGDDDQGRPIRVAVDFYIEGREGTTVVRLVQSGLSAASEWDEMYDALVDGWSYFLFNLGYWFQHHRGKTRRMAWKRAATELAREVAWQALVGGGLIADGEPTTTAHLEIDIRRPATIVSTRKGRHFTAALPDLDDALLFVELEGAHIGFWLSSYTASDDELDRLQTALEARIDSILGGA